MEERGQPGSLLHLKDSEGVPPQTNYKEDFSGRIFDRLKKNVR